MRRANENENSMSERAKTDDVHSNVQKVRSGELPASSLNPLPVAVTNGLHSLPVLRRISQ